MFGLEAFVVNRFAFESTCFVFEWVLLVRVPCWNENDEHEFAWTSSDKIKVHEAASNYCTMILLDHMALTDTFAPRQSKFIFLHFPSVISLARRQLDNDDDDDELISVNIANNTR